jgi:hypothetical protein
MLSSSMAVVGGSVSAGEAAILQNRSQSGVFLVLELKLMVPNS